MKRISTAIVRTILIVEDNRETLDLVDTILSREGYATIKAENGKDAINIAVGNRIDLVVLDLNLPDYDGIEVLYRLKMVDEAIHVIILTGHGSQTAVRSAMEMGVFDFVTKPFDIHEICDVVREALFSQPTGARLGRHHVQ
jgi:DNA-binding response OmpR family regulator